jgi:hypothetical protein
VVDATVDLGINTVPKFFWRSFFQAEVTGNSVCMWEK